MPSYQRSRQHWKRTNWAKDEWEYIDLWSHRLLGEVRAHNRHFLASTWSMTGEVSLLGWFITVGGAKRAIEEACHAKAA